MLILGLDVATTTGWALYDTDKGVSAIESGSFRLAGADAFEKVVDMRHKLPRLIREKRPDFAAIEEPMKIAPRFKKVRRDMLGAEEDTGETTINTKTIADLNEFAGAATMAVLGQNVPCARVAAKRWQTIIPKTIAGKPKQRAKSYCETLKIVSPNMDSRDACIIAIWAAGHCQELKLMARAAA